MTAKPRKPTYIQHTALGKLIDGRTHGHPIAPKTMKVLEREGWARDGQVTFAGRVAHWEGSHPDVRGPRPVQHPAHRGTVTSCRWCA